MSPNQKKRLPGHMFAEARLCFGVNFRAFTGAREAMGNMVARNYMGMYRNFNGLARNVGARGPMAYRHAARAMRMMWPQMAGYHAMRGYMSRQLAFPQTQPHQAGMPFMHGNEQMGNQVNGNGINHPAYAQNQQNPQAFNQQNQQQANNNGLPQQQQANPNQQPAQPQQPENQNGAKQQANGDRVVKEAAAKKTGAAEVRAAPGTQPEMQAKAKAANEEAPTGPEVQAKAGSAEDAAALVKVRAAGEVVNKEVGANPPPPAEIKVKVNNEMLEKEFIPDVPPPEFIPDSPPVTPPQPQVKKAEAEAKGVEAKVKAAQITGKEGVAKEQGQKKGEVSQDQQNALTQKQVTEIAAKTTALGATPMSEAELGDRLNTPPEQRNERLTKLMSEYNALPTRLTNATPPLDTTQAPFAITFTPRSPSMRNAVAQILRQTFPAMNVQNDQANYVLRGLQWSKVITLLSVLRGSPADEKIMKAEIDAEELAKAQKVKVDNAATQKAEEDARKIDADFVKKQREEVAEKRKEQVREMTNTLMTAAASEGNDRSLLSYTVETETNTTVFNFAREDTPRNGPVPFTMNNRTVSIRMTHRDAPAGSPARILRMTHSQNPQGIDFVLDMDVDGQREEIDIRLTASELVDMFNTLANQRPFSLQNGRFRVAPPPAN